GLESRAFIGMDSGTIPSRARAGTPTSHPEMNSRWISWAIVRRNMAEEAVREFFAGEESKTSTNFLVKRRKTTNASRSQHEQVERRPLLRESRRAHWHTSRAS